MPDHQPRSKAGDPPEEWHGLDALFRQMSDSGPCPGCGSYNIPEPSRFGAPHDPAYHLVTDKPPTTHAPGCTTAPHPDRECAPELDRLSDPHDCEPDEAGAACRVCGLPAERDDITPAELVALITNLEPEIGSRYIDGDGETWEVRPGGADVMIEPARR